ncbi:hypothetical protein QN277_017809 [Acacia crassicarpa]|uniref:BSD domain-containing protein n=1 Tax=Acacia crassicarpa TaxID=499986 RepID=A0AAE1MS59_9FABA|nr:hypothetical protein QN277_017809 [Acacia crassicarpa]
MSWLGRSLANSLRLGHDDTVGDDDDDCDFVPYQPHDPPPTSPKNHETPHLQQHQPLDNEFGLENEVLSRGVQEDLHVFKQTLTRQFWGMASFLAPPPLDSHPSYPSHRHTQSFPAASTRNRSDPSDRCVSQNVGESEARRFRRVFSHIEEATFHRHATETLDMNPISISFGSQSLRNEETAMEEHGFERAVGITDEVLAFASNIAMHPETWLDYPVEEEDDTDDFDMSDAQQEHALAIERLDHRLAALRIELCPCHMSESYFWKVYFVLLHSRLNKQDAEVLSTPQVLAARALWMEELQKQEKLESECFGRSTSYSRDTAPHEDFSPRSFDDSYYGVMPRGTYRFEEDYESGKHMGESSEAHFIDKVVVEENSKTKTEDKDLSRVRSSKLVLEDYEDDEYEWPEDDIDGITVPVVNEEDISFSDLEDDNFSLRPFKSKTESNAP